MQLLNKSQMNNLNVAEILVVVLDHLRLENDIKVEHGQVS